MAGGAGVLGATLALENLTSNKRSIVNGLLTANFAFSIAVSLNNRQPYVSDPSK